jgi:SAM-dependent methyltransferase
MTPTDAIPLLQVLGGYYGIWVLHAAARLGLADRLRERPLMAAELAEACGANGAAMRRFLDSLAAVGVVEQTRSGAWALTAAGQWLRADVPGSLRPSALMCGDRSFFEAWSHCADAVRTGRPSFETANGVSFFEHLDRDPEALETFHGAMTGFPHINAQLLDVFDFGARRCVLDVGGGTGSLVRAVLDAHPHVAGMVLDRPSVIEAAHREGRADPRIGWVAGDFLEAVPAGADTHVLRFVLSDWSDEDVLRILERSREALPEDGCLLVVDNLRDDAYPSMMAALDLTMLVLTGGRARSAEEYDALLERAGFAVRRRADTPARATVLVATPR